MLISNNDLLSRINAYGLDKTINSIDPEKIENDVIKIIVRTIKQSQEILVSSLEEMVSDLPD